MLAALVLLLSESKKKKKTCLECAFICLDSLFFRTFKFLSIIKKENV